MRGCVFVIGTRAQLVKVAPVLRIASLSGLRSSVWLAGQHQESIDDLIADFELQGMISGSAIKQENSSVGRLLKWLPRALRECHGFIRKVAAQDQEKPLVAVHGDTLSTVVGAVAGRIAGCEIVHLESGLSSGRLLDPFPEELLRRITFRLTRYALCPNPEASARMQRLRDCETIDTGGNTLLDGVRFALTEHEIGEELGAKDYFVASIHRFSNIYDREQLNGIVNELIEVSAIGDVYFVLHPPTERRLRQTGLLSELTGCAGIKLEPRMSFTRFIAHLACARGVFSDGGSNQEELSYLGVPTVLFRKRSERPDGIGANIVFRKDIPGSLSQFVASGKLDCLRQERRIDENVQPSRISVEALLGWAGGAT